MSAIHLDRLPMLLPPDSSRVIIRPFIPDDPTRVATIIGRALALTDDEVRAELDDVTGSFSARHSHLETQLRMIYQRVEAQVFTQRPLIPERELLIGALFAGEYAIEAAALFNPSVVPHPDQSGMPPGCLRFIMSLRATGEGHISSIEFREGTVTENGGISLEPVSRFCSPPRSNHGATYRKRRFLIKLHEMAFDEDTIAAIMDPLPESFTRGELDARLELARHDALGRGRGMNRTAEFIGWLAESNYEISFGEDIPLGERVIFPASSNESHGIEDARFVRFTEPDGSVMYYATYTAYNGRTTLPQLIETTDFTSFRILTLNGCAVRNKGMALFPRRIGDRYVMLSRQDDENLLLMRSPSPHYWSTPQVILRPAGAWESVKIGNCGSPIETAAGWLVITHGVGPMRRYCIGAALLDLEDPSKVIGRLREPLLEPEDHERNGYVPNVVYSCGSLVHGDRLILPFAVNDHAAAITSVPLQDLLDALTSGQGGKARPSLGKA